MIFNFIFQILDKLKEILNKKIKFLNLLLISNKMTYFERQTRQRERYRARMNERIEELNEFFLEFGLKIENLTLIRFNPNNPGPSFRIKPSMIIDRIITNNEIMVFQSIRAKDNANLSQVKYQLLRKDLNIIKTTATLKQIKFMANRLNNFRVSFFLTKYLENYFLNIFDTIRIKIASDVTNVTKTKIKILNITATIINDFKNAVASRGNLSLNYLIFNFIKKFYLRNFILGFTEH